MPGRADALRNRERVLVAARRLFAEQGVASVSMDEIAAAARVGKGTLYRGFGDRAGLAVALLDDAERKLQEQLIRGRPPLGPGAPAEDRVRAFVRAYVALLERHLDLIVESQSASTGARFRVGAYHAWRQHLGVLAREAGADDSLLPDLLLAALDGSLYKHLRRDRRLSARRIREAVERLALGAFAR